MRPTTSIMLQQNNNNNYPCLNVSGSTREMLQKCSRASLPFPSRLELGLGDLPLIRGLRAWALCSRNRCKASGLLGGGPQTPTAPPAGRGSSTYCPRPADVYLSEEWGRMGYGLPLGLDARQAGIGALVTVATLKTSEGSGKTQTQCLFLRTEKGSCLYSTAKPGSGAATSAASSVVGGWLRGKTGGGRDAPTGRRDNGPTLPAQTGANRVRVRSGRRWRKSGNAAGHEKIGVSRERQQRRREDPAGERQEERDKGGLDSKPFPSPQQDGRRARQEKEGACRSPRCCHNASPKTCTQCGRSAQRRESQDEGEGGESHVPNRLNGEAKARRKEEQKNEEEEKGGLRELESFNSVLAVPNPDLKSNPQSPSGCDAEIREAASNKELKMQTSHCKNDCSEKEQDTNPEMIKIHTGSNDFIHVHSGQLIDDFKSRHNRGFDDREPTENPCEQMVANLNGFSDCVEADEESEKEKERVDVEEDERSFNQTPAEDASISTHPASINTAVAFESSKPVEGSMCSDEHEARWVKREQNGQEGNFEGFHLVEADAEIMGKEELVVSRFEPQEPNCVADENNTVKPQLFFKNEDSNSQLEEKEASSSPFRHRDPSVFETSSGILTENSCDHRTIESEQRDELESEDIEERLNAEEGAEAEEIWRREFTCNKLDNGSGKGDDDVEQHAMDEVASTIWEESYKEVKRNCAPEDNRRLQDSADGCRGRKKTDGDACSETGFVHVEENGETSTNSNVACADPSTSLALSLANPDPSLPPLESMATGLPCLEEEGGLGATAGDGGREENKRHGRELELEEQGEEERVSTVATVEGRKQEEDEDEFGVFVQAEGELAWNKGFTMSASVPCGSRESVALGSHAITGESTHWTPGWTDGSIHQSDDTWTAFPQDSSDEGRNIMGQWWPTGAVGERRDGLAASHNLAAVFAEAFPSLPGSFSSDSCDLDTVPTLTQLLGGRTSQDQGLLDSFHDLNKMIGERYKRASGVSRDLLLKTLHLEQPHTESRPAPWTANRRLSPGLPSANHHAHNAAAKRRLSYDYNRNIME